MTNTTTQTMTIKDASEKLGVTIRTLQRQIKQGKYKSYIRKGKRYIKISATNDATMSQENVAPPPTKKNAEVPTIPQGYILIDKATLEDLRGQLKELTTSVREMQSTQKLLIEKGLGLQQLPPATTTTNATTEPRQDSDNVVVDVADKSQPKNKKHSDKHHDTDAKMSQDVSQDSEAPKDATQGHIEVSIEPDNNENKQKWYNKPFWNLFKS